MDKRASTCGRTGSACVSDVLDALDHLFPYELAGLTRDDGLALGDLSSPVTGVLCAASFDETVVEAASESGHDLIVCQHPVRLCDRSVPGAAEGRLDRPLSRAMDAGLSVIACRENAIDSAGGAADLMAGALGLRGCVPLVPSGRSFVAKVVVFVPGEAVEAVSEAMWSAGGGVLGRYANCSFRSPGTGTFMPGEGTEPYSGKPGELSLVEETRLEMVCPSFALRRLTRAMVEAHPYEEVAYDVLETANPVPWGRGRVGDITPGVEPGDLVKRIEGWRGTGGLGMPGDLAGVVSRVAVAPGSGDGLAEAASEAGAQAIVAGEMGSLTAMEARRLGLAVITLGYRESLGTLAGAFAGCLRRMKERKGLEIEIDTYDEQGA